MPGCGVSDARIDPTAVAGSWSAQQEDRRRQDRYSLGRSRVRLFAVVTIEGLALWFGGMERDSSSGSVLHCKIGDFKTIGPFYCCTVCIAVIHAEKIDQSGQPILCLEGAECRHRTRSPRRSSGSARPLRASMSSASSLLAGSANWLAGKKQGISADSELARRRAGKICALYQTLTRQFPPRVNRVFF